MPDPISLFPPLVRNQVFPPTATKVPVEAIDVTVTPGDVTVTITPDSFVVET